MFERVQKEVEEVVTKRNSYFRDIFLNIAPRPNHVAAVILSVGR